MFVGQNTMFADGSTQFLMIKSSFGVPCFQGGHSASHSSKAETKVMFACDFLGGGGGSGSGGGEGGTRNYDFTGLNGD